MFNAAASAEESGGVKRVFTFPASGALVMIPSAHKPWNFSNPDAGLMISNLFIGLAMKCRQFVSEREQMQR